MNYRVVLLIVNGIKYNTQQQQSLLHKLICKEIIIIKLRQKYFHLLAKT